MAAKPSVGKPAAKRAEVVLVPFAYATAKNGEVVRLVRHDVVIADRFTDESLGHLRSIGFVGAPKS